MQDRMQSDSRLLDAVYSAVFGTLFPLFLFLARAIERRSRAFEIADAVVSAFMALRPKYLDAVKANVAQVLGKSLRNPEVERVARRIVRNHAYAWVDFFHYGQRPPEVAFKNFATLEGGEHMDRLLTGKRGAILLTAHAGNFELGGLLLKSRGLQVHAVYKPDRFEAVERLRNRIRRQGGVVGVPVDGIGFSTLPLLKLLREGKLVGMQGDRDFSMNGLPVPFFGREVHFPRGPWELAAMTGAPVIATFFFMDADMRFHAKFFEPIHVERERTRRMASIERGMRQYVRLLEELVRANPDQWYCFYPFWDDPLRKALD
jgi:KDO2-lipid IV(A) lauroyltransferase